MKYLWIILTIALVSCSSKKQLSYLGESSLKETANYADYLLADFQDVTRGGVAYKALFAFSDHIDGGIFDFTFNEAISYTNWFNDFVYIIVPTELVPNLTTMVAEVEDIVFEDQFDVPLEKVPITSRNGNTGEIVTLSVKMITCKVARWETGDDEKLASIIQLFNSFYNPPRHINFKCKFDSLTELEEFKAGL
jgi:hypothetical protein